MEMLTHGLTKTASGLEVASLRKNGKHFHVVKAAFRPNAGQTTFVKRMEKRQEFDLMKGRERLLKEQNEEARQKKIETIRARRIAKEEKEHYEQMAQRMHRKRVERLKRREKRNKMLKS